MRRLGFAVLATLATACQPPPVAPTPLAAGTQVPDFSLTDVNPASPRAGTNLGPSTFAGTVTGWYFGHSS